MNEQVENDFSPPLENMDDHFIQRFRPGVGGVISQEEVAAGFRRNHSPIKNLTVVKPYAFSKRMGGVGSVFNAGVDGSLGRSLSVVSVLYSRNWGLSSSEDEYCKEREDNDETGEISSLVSASISIFASISISNSNSVSNSVSVSASGS
jgi:hypothetical protein